MSSLRLLKEKNPLVICITNDVVKNFTANGLVALGASPAMSEYKKDLVDLLRYAGGEEYNVPAVLDPVACGAGEYRKKVAQDLITNYKLSAIRGNAGEIAALIGGDVASKGVDSATVEDIGALALKANKELNIPIVVTGEIDAIAADGKVKLIKNGSAMMPKVIGTGCLLGAVVASFVGLNNDIMKNLETAMLAYNIAGEMAEKQPRATLPGTFKEEFINALYTVSDSDIEKYKKVEEYV